MAKQYKVLVNTGKAENNKAIDVQQYAGDKGQPVRIKAQAGTKYQLQELGKDKGRNTAPDYVKAKRNGKNLEIAFENGTSPDLIIEGYYDEMPAGYNGLIGQAENGSYYEYIPEDPNPQGLIPELADGARPVNVALGAAEVSPAGAAVGVLAFPLLAPLGLLGAGAAALAAANNAGTNTPVVTGALQAAAPNDSGTLGDNRTNDSTPTLTGTVPAGSTATITINGQIYPVTVNADGTWSFTQPTNLPDGTYTITATATDAAGNTATDTDSAATTSNSSKTALSIDPISDNVILASEQGVANYTVTGKVTGVFKTGDTVNLTLNGKNYTTTVAADGSYSMVVPSRADGTYVLRATIVNSSGNPVNATGTVLANGAKAADGWAALAGLDTNADGVINAMDAQFADLRVWRDADGDGVTDAGELVSLQDAGIASISLAHDGSITAQNGNLLTGQGVVTHTDGSTTQVTDAWLATEKLSGVEHPMAEAPALDGSLATLNLVGLNDVQVSLDNLGATLANLSGNAKPDLLHLNVSDVLQLPTTAAGVHQLEVLGDANDVVDLSSLFADGHAAGQWAANGQVTQNGHTFNVYQYSGDQTLQVLIDQHIVQSNVHLS